jgi:site-specific recombinase XerD
MNLESMFFRRPKYRAGVLEGPLGPYIDGFIASVFQVGYTPGSLRSLVLGAVNFGRYLAKMQLCDLRKLRDKHVRDYIATTRPQRHGKYCFHVSPGARAAPHVLRYLRRLGVALAAGPPSRQFPILEEWLTFLRDHRGLAEKSLRLYGCHIVKFLEHLGRDATSAGLKRLSPERIRDYIRARASTYGRSERKMLVSTLRAFLRWAFGQGYLRRDLTIAVERVPSFKHEHLPRGPRWKDLLKLLQVPDRGTAQGRRDYAILLLLITYGVRAHQVGTLQLGDIDWRRMLVHFKAAKRGRDVQVPLTIPVGEALVKYLRMGRPETPGRYFFISMRPPVRPLLAVSINNIVSRAFRLAGVPSPHRGSHAIRHAWATRMLAQGQPLKTIADLLGHRSIETTRIYTKVDYTRLHEVALPWPRKDRR